MTDEQTKFWVRNESDAKAAAAGYRFDPESGAYVVWWIERYCRLYEGEWAGEPLVLRGAWSDDRDYHCDEWDEAGIAAGLSRAQAYCEAVAAGEPIDWQYECVMRLFGWVKHSERWGREVRRFRGGSVWVAKKNKKSPTLAAIALYLLCGDNEQGQKVFPGAKDGQQARDNVGRHVVEMVMASPELSAACKINRNLMRVVHEESRSMLQPLSSSDSRSKKAKEGINGSILIDETHVVDRDFVSRISRAGISRSEPMFLKFSTSGDDPESYGKEDFEYGADVEAGRTTDHTYFYYAATAPQSVTDAEIHADPIRYGKMANPAWGHTISEDEYLADYNQAKRSVREFALFKMYRLNIWQKAANIDLLIPEVGLWDQCKTDKTIADFAGQACYAGLDLSRTRDTTALVVTFRDPQTDDEGEDADEYYQFAWFWSPEQYASDHGDKADFAQWEADGHLELCPGKTIDQRQIDAVIREINEQTPITEIRYDLLYATELVTRLEEDLGIVAVPFKQTIIEFAGPTKEFRALVDEGRIHHDGHPVYSWQLGHARTKSDPNNNIRVIKPTDGDVRKVDGVIAGIMSLSGAMAAEVSTGPSFFYLDGANT